MLYTVSKLTRVEHLSDVLFEIFSAFFDAGGLAPIKTKKAKIAGRAH